MLQSKFLKSTNDFIIGLALLALGIYVLLTDDIVTGNISTGDGGLLVRPDVYVRLIGALLAFFSLVLTVKSINFTRLARARAQARGLEFTLSREVVATVAALAVYALLLDFTAKIKYYFYFPDGVGFFIATFLLIAFLTLTYIRKERYSDGIKGVPREVIRRELIITFIYTIILDAVVWVIFSKVLFVSLP
jgi:hypothetical protein